jgi:hypothetical protein
MSQDQKIIGRVGELCYGIFQVWYITTLVGNMEDLFENSEPEATAASHLSRLKILDGVLHNSASDNLLTSVLVNSLLIS